MRVQGRGQRISVTGFHDEQGRLLCDGVSVAHVAEQAGTPVYVYSAPVIRARYREFDRSLSAHPHLLHYALKANSTLELVKLMRALGAAVDANSGGEIDVALRAGYSPRDIVFTGVGKTADELARAVALGVKTINAESAGELARIDAIGRAHARSVNVAVRINPDVDAMSHPHMSTGTLAAQFGVPFGEAATVCREATTRDGLKLVGIHMHIGSQIVTLEPIRRAARVLATLAQELRDSGIALEHIDVGGGLGISYDGSPVPLASDYAATLMGELGHTGLMLLLEPGRWIVGPAGALVVRVVDVKTQRGGRSFIVLDAGMSEFLRPALYGARHRIRPVTPREGPQAAFDVVGPLCETSDSFGTEHRLPPLEVGDLVAVLDAGAYGATMASNYNRRPRPAEVLVDGGDWRVIRRRETIEAMLADELSALDGRQE